MNNPINLNGIINNKINNHTLYKMFYNNNYASINTRNKCYTIFCYVDTSGMDLHPDYNFYFYNNHNFNETSTIISNLYIQSNWKFSYIDDRMLYSYNEDYMIYHTVNSIYLYLTYHYNDSDKFKYYTYSYTINSRQNMFDLKNIDNYYYYLYKINDNYFIDKITITKIDSEYNISSVEHIDISNITTKISNTFTQIKISFSTNNMYNHILLNCYDPTNNKTIILLYDFTNYTINIPEPIIFMSEKIGRCKITYNRIIHINNINYTINIYNGETYSNQNTLLNSYMFNNNTMPSMIDAMYAYNDFFFYVKDNKIYGYNNQYTNSEIIIEELFQNIYDNYYIDYYDNNKFILYAYYFNNNLFNPNGYTENFIFSPNYMNVFNNNVNINNILFIKQNNKQLNFGYNNAPYISTNDDNLCIIQGNLTSFDQATNGIKLSSNSNEIKGNSYFNGDIIFNNNSNSIKLYRNSSDYLGISPFFTIQTDHGTEGGLAGLYSNSYIPFYIGHSDANIRLGHYNQDQMIFNAGIIYFNGDPIHGNSSKLSKLNNFNIPFISICDDLINMFVLKIDNNKYIIDKYTSYNKYQKIFEFDKVNTIYNIYYYNNYLLLLSEQGIDYINLLDKELILINLIKDININKIVIDPKENQFYILYNSYDYFTKYEFINNEFIKSDYHVFTEKNGYNLVDLNIIDMKFYNDYIYFIHPLYKNNNNYYIVYSNYTENEIIRKQTNISFTNEYYYIDSYVYDNYIYFLITKNGSSTKLIKINKDNVNYYEIIDNIINDNITQYNKNIYYKYNDNHFYLVSNNYIYYYNIENDLLQLENKFYTDGCKYITNKQDIYISNTEICYIDGSVILNGNILLNEKIKTSSINASQINIQDIDINVNKTIIHNTLIDENIDNYQVCQPVFIKNNKTFSLQRKSNNDKYPIYEYIEINKDNYIKNSINQIPMITNEYNTENNYKFIGIITAIYPANTPLKINEITSNYIKINNNTIDFATHGDYIFKIQNNIEHEITSGGSRMYQIGDEILYDGTIIDQNYPITRLQENNSVGIITYIPEDNTDYISIFKK